MLLAAGTQEEDGPPATAQGAYNLTAEGEQVFRNAINYMVPSWTVALLDGNND